MVTQELAITAEGLPWYAKDDYKHPLADSLENPSQFFQPIKLFELHEGAMLEFTYINHEDKEEVRHVTLEKVFWGTTDFYPEPCLIIRAYCLGRKSVREFNVNRMKTLQVVPDKAICGVG